MNVKNIKPELVVKNYKTMCDLLDEPVLGGNSKKAQLKEWKRNFNFEKQGHKFIIKEVYAIPIPKDFAENDIYTKYVNITILKYLKKEGCGNFTMTQLLKLCGFVNNNIGDMSLLHEYSENNDITFEQSKYYYNQLYYHIYTYCVTAIIRCLNRLQKRDFLRWHKQLWITKLENSNKFIIATEDEYKKYLNIVNRVKKKLNMTYISVYNKDEYYREIKNEIYNLGWSNAIEFINIIYADEFIDEYIESAEEQYLDALLTINTHCLEQMYTYVDIDIENYIKKLALKMNEDIDLVRLWTNVEKIKSKKTDITNMYVEVKV